MAGHPEFPMWSAILRWSLAQQASDPVARSEPPPPLDPEKQKFLTDFFKEYSVDYAKRLCEILKTLSEGSQPGSGATEEELAKALEELEDLVESLDWARDLCKLGGVEVLFGVAEAAETTPRVKARALQAVAAATQNDEPTQAAVVAKVGLGRLVAAAEASLAGAAAGGEDWARAGFSALSGTVRGNGALEAELLAGGDAARVIAAALRRAADRAEPRLANKAAFFLKALLVSDAAPQERLDKLGAALDAALDWLDATDQPPDDPVSMQARESATAALVHAFKAGFQPDNSRADALRRCRAKALQRAEDDGFREQAALWAKLPPP